MVIFVDIYIRILYPNIIGHSGSTTVLHPYVTQTALVCYANSSARYLGSGTSINYRNYSNYRYVRICGTPPNHPEMVDYVVFLSETNGSWGPENYETHTLQPHTSTCWHIGSNCCVSEHLTFQTPLLFYNPFFFTTKLYMWIAINHKIAGQLGTFKSTLYVENDRWRAVFRLSDRSRNWVYTGGKIRKENNWLNGQWHGWICDTDTSKLNSNLNHFDFDVQHFPFLSTHLPK